MPEQDIRQRYRLTRAGIFVLLAGLRGGRIVLREGGREHSFGSPGRDSLDVTVDVRDGRFYSAFLRGSLGLAEAYRDGAWECDDLVGLTRIGARNMGSFDRLRSIYRLAERPARLIGAALHNPLSHKQRTARHYNTGNDLFELFLDETMAYSCGVFERGDESLSESSHEKFDRICRKLDLGPGDHVLEIGTGWGGFAQHAAGRYGCRVTTATIAREQASYAAARVREAGLEDLVEIVEADFAQLTGSYDKLVSIEMIESIGWRRFEEFFRVCDRLLKPAGAMLLQAIMIDDDAYEAEKLTKTFINTLIFDGGSLPSNRFIADTVASQTNMRIAAHEDMTPWYSRTLHLWRQRFADAAPEIAWLGYDERFRRVWDLYLAYCEAGFIERRITVGQTLVAKPGWAGPREAPVARTAALPV